MGAGPHCSIRGPARVLRCPGSVKDRKEQGPGVHSTDAVGIAEALGCGLEHHSEAPVEEVARRGPCWAWTQLPWRRDCPGGGLSWSLCGKTAKLKGFSLTVSFGVCKCMFRSVRFPKFVGILVSFKKLCNALSPKNKKEDGDICFQVHTTCPT